MPNKNFKNEIIQMRNEGLSYRDIQQKLNCSRGTINYHCRMQNLTDTGKKRHAIPDDLKLSIAQYYTKHSLKETAKAFKLSESTINKFKNYKPVDEKEKE